MNPGDGTNTTVATNEPVPAPERPPGFRGMVLIVCAWCKNLMGACTGTAEQDGNMSHAMCPECLRKHFPEDADRVLAAVELEKSERQVAA